MTTTTLLPAAVFQLALRLMLALIVSGAATALVRADEPTRLIEFRVVRETVLRDFASRPYYKPGDLLSRGEVEPIFSQLRKMGWLVADRKAILNSFPADNDFLVEKLRTTAGVKFMRQISGYPQGYDRLWHLAALPDGRRIVTDLINGRGGSEMIQYLTTSAGGKNLGKMLSRTPRGHDFNKPTGMLYTADDLIARLEKSHQAAAKQIGDPQVVVNPYDQ